MQEKKTYAFERVLAFAMLTGSMGGLIKAAQKPDFDLQWVGIYVSSAIMFVGYVIVTTLCRMGEDR